MCLLGHCPCLWARSDVLVSIRARLGDASVWSAPRSNRRIVCPPTWSPMKSIAGCKVNSVLYRHHGGAGVYSRGIGFPIVWTSRLERRLWRLLPKKPKRSTRLMPLTPSILMGGSPRKGLESLVSPRDAHPVFSPCVSQNPGSHHESLWGDRPGSAQAGVGSVSCPE